MKNKKTFYLITIFIILLVFIIISGVIYFIITNNNDVRNVQSQIEADQLAIEAELRQNNTN